MKKLVRIAIIISTLCLSLTSMARSLEDDVKFQGLQRHYYISFPENADANTPVVICLHGHGGNYKGFIGFDYERVALQHGFAFCIPAGLESPAGHRSWNVGYPSQEGMKVDDVAFMVFLAKYLPAKYGLDKRNIFLTGLSNGGEMCYIMSYKHPEAFRAICSFAGLQMRWTVDKLKSRGPVHFMEVHGTKDVTSYWEGDPDDKYGWGPYLAVPAAIANVVSNNRCTHYSKIDIPGINADSKPVILHLYDCGDAEVRLYEVVGGIHNWSNENFDSYGEAMRFFEAHLVK